MKFVGNAIFMGCFEVENLTISSVSCKLVEVFGKGGTL